MVACRSCGRNIASGTIRCSKCGTPFHLSCSHRYKISSDGVFNVCCGPTDSGPFSGNGSYQMRTRRGAKRRQQQQQSQIVNNPLSNENRTAVASPGVIPPLIQEEQDNSGMRYTKIQKTTEEMVVSQKPFVQEDNECAEIIQEQDYIELDNENDNTDYGELNNSIEILEESINNVNHNLNDNNGDNDDDNDNDNDVKVLTDMRPQNVNASNDMNNKVTLDTVWQGISALQSSISNISNSLDSVSTHLNTFDPRMNELESSLNTIKAKTSNFENVQNDVSGLREELERVTTELENIKTNQMQKNVDLSEIFQEIKERDMKSRNLLIYNVPEDNLRISQDYSTLEDINQFNALLASRDASRAREILGNIPNVDVDDLQTRRLGRVNPNTCRPLRVTLSCKEDVITVMKNRALVSSQYTVKTDLTRFQQRKIKELKEELDKINVNQRNPTMTIKFVNGEPKLMPIARRNWKNE
ncbi:GATA zinc finger domain-containing protein 24 [Nasonia vitripennis]|uniref:Uncharacterized protein n=1 Tax=Nasonia vitripennis TaxID=7425 RepID=A0A7M7GDD0_NASVI|nr:GATA zinc finger domain-containing protein 24 [Nasonia vitripennis]